MTWVEAALGPLERLLAAEAEEGRDAVRARLEGLRLAYLDARTSGRDCPLAEGLEVARTKGTWVLWMLRRRLSPPGFEPLRAEWHRGRCLDTASLEREAARLAGADLRGYFDFWVRGTRLPDYRLLRAEASRQSASFELRITLENRGSGAAPVPIVAQTEEGARHELVASAEPGRPSEIRFTVLTRPVAAAADPEGDVLMATGARGWTEVRLRRAWVFGR